MIQPLVLTAGQTDTLDISDLFYAKTYDLVFHPSEILTVIYDEQKGRLILRADADFEGFALLQFQFEGNEYQVPIHSRIKQKHLFTHKPKSKPENRMNIMGTFNDWNRNSLPMRDDAGDGIYEIEIELDPGQYLYQFVIDESEIWDRENPVKVDNGFGSFNSVVSIPPRHTEKASLHVLGYEETESELVLSFIYERDKHPQKLSRDDLFCLINNSNISDEWLRIAENRIEVALPKSKLGGEQIVRLGVSQAGQTTNLQTVRLVAGHPIGLSADFTTWHDAVIYSIMIDRFFDADSSNSRPVQHPELSPQANYMGGDLEGVLQKIEMGYFDSLGVNTLWISPVNENTNQAFKEWPPPHRTYSAYHGYWPIHHQRVEERFGDLELLQKMIAKSHEHGIQVLLDFTANHVHQEHPFFQEHRDWFGTYELPDGRENIRLWDEYRLTTWFDTFMPSFDYLGSEEALQAMTDNAIWWLKQTNADGFRHDATKHVPNRFWRELTRKIKQNSNWRRIFQIGETFGSYDLIRSYVNNGQMNAQFNFNLYDVALYVFLNDAVDFGILDKELQKTFSVYGQNHLMGNVMDSHDKVRFMAYVDGDLELNSSKAQEIGWANPPKVDHPQSYAMAQLYLAYILTIPGVPVLYYGDEIGITGAADPDNRRMMRFGKDLSEHEAEMLAEVRRLVHLRREHSALRYGDFQSRVADKNCFAYLRSDMNERILVLLNKSKKQQSLSIPIPLLYKITSGRDLVSGQTYALAEGSISVILPPIGFSILKLE